MLEQTSAEVVRHLGSIDRKSADLCSEIHSLRMDIQNEGSKAEFRFCFGVIMFFCILLPVVAAVAKLR